MSALEDSPTCIACIPGLALTGTMDSSDTSACNTRRLARPFYDDIPHHPFLDPEFQWEYASLVPRDLAPRGRLNWELPRPAKTNLHIMLELKEETDGILEEYRSKLPFIDQAIEEWVEMRGASPTTTGEAKLRDMASLNTSQDVEHQGEQHDTSTDSYIFSMARDLDSPGRADVIYLADAFEQKKAKDRKSSIPENLRAVDWLDFDGSYLHVAEASHAAEAEMGIPDAVPILKTPKSGRRTNSRPPNLRISDWSESVSGDVLPASIYSPEPESAGSQACKPTGPFQDFWQAHDNSYGNRMELANDLPVPQASGQLSVTSPTSSEPMDHQFLRRRRGMVFDHEEPAQLREAACRFDISP